MVVCGRLGRMLKANIREILKTMLFMPRPFRALQSDFGPPFIWKGHNYHRNILNFFDDPLNDAFFTPKDGEKLIFAKKHFR